jgi:hypothetical protein
LHFFVDSLNMQVRGSPCMWDCKTQLAFKSASMEVLKYHPKSTARVVLAPTHTALKHTTSNLCLSKVTFWISLY